MGKVQFVLNGKDACVGGPGPQARKIIDFVNKIPDGKYFDHAGIAACLSMTNSAVEQSIRRHMDAIQGHFLYAPAGDNGGRKFIYGSKKSIVALTKQLQAEDLI